MTKRRGPPGIWGHGGGDHIGILEIWSMGMCVGAQADAGEPGNGCSSVLGHFQG